MALHDCSIRQGVTYMSMIVFNSGKFFYADDDGKRRLLLDAGEICGKHNVAAMNKQLGQPHGQAGDEAFFLSALMRHIEVLKGIGSAPVGYVLLTLMLLNDLWKKPHPVKVLRVGGSSSDLLSLEWAKILREFHPDSVLCCMCDDDRHATEKNITSLPKDMKGVKLMQRQFSALLLDDMKGELEPEVVSEVLPSLRPFGRFFCLTSQDNMKDACFKVLPDAGKMRTDGELFLFEQECPYEEWTRAWESTPAGRLVREKAGLELKMRQLRMDVKDLDFMEERRVRRMIKQAKELEFSMAEICTSLASVDAKPLSMQFREALIDWYFGNADTQRVQACFEILWDDLLQHHDIRLGNEGQGQYVDYADGSMP